MLSEKTQSEAEKHRLIGGVLCLDFANTLNGHGKTPLHEYLAGYTDLVVWGQKAGILAASEAAPLIRNAERRSSEASEAFDQAIALRETIFRVFSAHALGKLPTAADIERLNRARADALAHSVIKRSEDGFALTWIDKTAFDSVLWPIVLSAVDLLTSDQLLRVRECEGDTCDWLFVDTSRNHMRRWCSMAECGNRAKMRRFLDRKRKAR
jgi:predicted RNA-binding Zn ribbon-like protein